MDNLDFEGFTLRGDLNCRISAFHKYRHFPNMYSVQLRAVAFDIDGTLYANRPMYFRAAFHVVIRLRFFYHFAAVRAKIRTVYPIDDFQALQRRLLGEAMGISEEVAAERIRKWISDDLDAVYRRLRPFRDVEECIRLLRDHGLKLGVLSDFPIGKKLDYLGLDGLWDCEISSEDTGYLKPRTEPFAALSDRLGVEPEHILYIGNSYEYDIVGASKAGLRTAYLTRKVACATKSVTASSATSAGEKVERTADFSFSDYRQLAPMILEFVRQ